MSHRRSHTKSRRGCFQCKKRHAKCDEAKPKCSNCIRLETDCSWPPSINLAASSIIPPDRLQESQSGSPAPLDLAIDELILIHHWTLHTSIGFDLTPILWKNAVNPWQDGIVELGFRNPFLLRAILSLAATHKATTLPLSQRSYLLMQSTMHIDIALQEFRNRLSTPDPQTAPAMFALSAILVVHHLAKAQTHIIISPIDELLGCFRLVRGIRIVLQPNLTEIMNTAVEPLLHIMTRNPIVDATPGFIRLNELCGDKEPYKQAVEKLWEVFIEVRSAKADQSPLSLLFLWPAVIQDDFMALLSAKDDIAIVVLSYYSVLLRLVGKAWWIKGWGTLIMNAVREHVTPGKYNDYLDEAANLFTGESERIA